MAAPALTASGRQLSETVGERSYWTAGLRLGFVVLGFEAAAALAYELETWSSPNRPALVGIGVLTIGLAVMGACLARRVAERGETSHFSLILTIASTIVLTFAAHLDGGIESPLLYLAALPVMYAGLLLGPRQVALCAAAALSSAALVRLGDPHVELPAQDVAMMSAFMLGVAVLAVGISAHRCRIEVQRSNLMTELRRRSATDELTGCWNQSAFHERLSEESARAHRDGRPLSLLVGDVDLLRQFNQMYGHASGDAALRAVGSRLRRCSRQSDIVARIGGDEFAVLMPDTPVDDARALARRVVAAVSSEPSPSLTVSYGLAGLDPSDYDGQQMFRLADAALYDAKERGRNRLSTACAAIAGGVTAADEKRTREVVRDARRERSQIEALLNVIVDEAPVGFVLVDHALRVVRINPTLAKLSGVAIEEHLGRTVEQAVPRLWKQLEAPLKHVIETGEMVRNFEISRPVDGEPSPFEATLSNFFPVQLGPQVGVGCIVIDISDRKRLERSQEELTDSVVKALAAATEARDPYTAGHQDRVGQIATDIAIEMGCDASTIRGIGLAASIHDIGKVAVPAEILSKPGRLTDAEMALVKTHADAGYSILHDIEFPWPVADMVRQHHERLDGSGYPLGLAGSEIGLGGRIIAVADVFEAMSAHRPYRVALGIETALATIVEGAGTLFDPAVVDACVRVVQAMPEWPRHHHAA